MLPTQLANAFLVELLSVHQYAGVEFAYRYAGLGTLLNKNWLLIRSGKGPDLLLAMMKISCSSRVLVR